MSSLRHCFTAVAFMIPALSLLAADGGLVTAADKAPTIAGNAQAVVPLGVGDEVPSVTVKNAKGSPVELASLVQQKPTVLVFYRGSWCPFCSKHTKSLVEIAPELEARGVQLVLVSPDRPEHVAKYVEKLEIPFTVLSDGSAEAIQAFGLAFEVSADTLERYKGFGIDLEAASGHDHHALPVPAVYLISTDGTVKYRHYDPNYRVRLSNAVLLEAVEEHFTK